MKEIKRVFSGVQPSGDPQLGNYLGAFKGWVDRQSEKENFFCVVDLHALTVTPDPKELVSQTRDLAAILCMWFGPQEKHIVCTKPCDSPCRRLLAFELCYTSRMVGAYDPIQR